MSRLNPQNKISALPIFASKSGERGVLSKKFGTGSISRLNSSGSDDISVLTELSIGCFHWKFAKESVGNSLKIGCLLSQIRPQARCDLNHAGDQKTGLNNPSIGFLRFLVSAITIAFPPFWMISSSLSVYPFITGILLSYSAAG